MPSLWQWDQDVFRLVHVGLRRDWLDPLFVALTFTGLGYAQAGWLLLANIRSRIRPPLFIGLAASSLLLIPLVERSPLGVLSGLLGLALVLTMNRAAAACALAALVLSGAVRILVAHTVQRERPSNLDFASPIEGVFGATSFPSGHATTTFAIATVACWVYARTEEAWIAWTLVAWSLVVGLSRVYVGVHYPLDVLAAAALGVAVGSLCFRYWAEQGWLKRPAEDKP